MRMPEEIVSDMQELPSRGQKAFEDFIETRIETNKTKFWAPMKRMNIQTFKSANKIQLHKPDGKMECVKNDRNLFARCIVITRSRPEVDMKEIFGQYELTYFPRAVFDASGKLLAAKDKSKLMEILDRTPKQQSLGQEIFQCIVIDGMAVLHQIQDSQQTCANLAAAFCSRVEATLCGSKEIHVIFDRYDLVGTASLKQETWNRCKGATSSVYLAIDDSTPLKKISMKTTAE
jgi:hypothetical protein